MKRKLPFPIAAQWYWYYTEQTEEGQSDEPSGHIHINLFDLIILNVSPRNHVLF